MTNCIFDFDSTLVKSETLNDMLEIALDGDQEKIKKIKEISDGAMNGLNISPLESINMRLTVATIDKNLINIMIEKSKAEITEGMVELIEKIKGRMNVFIVSGGFKEIIIPVAEILGIDKNNVFANEFLYDGQVVTGVADNILLQGKGKVRLIEKLKNDGILVGKNIMIGDGYTDLETYLYGAVDECIAFFGVVKRSRVDEEAKLKANTVKELDELLSVLSKKTLVL
jgi:phosphoserine phosphatase